MFCLHVYVSYSCLMPMKNRRGHWALDLLELATEYCHQPCGYWEFNQVLWKSRTASALLCFFFVLSKNLYSGILYCNLKIYILFISLSFTVITIALECWAISPAPTDLCSKYSGAGEMAQGKAVQREDCVWAKLGVVPCTVAPAL